MKISMGLTVATIGLLVGATCFFTFTTNDDLNAAARLGDLNGCKKLVSEGADPNGRGMHAMLPIMSAAGGGHLEVVEYLISVGADSNGHNESGSALMWAVDSQNEDVVRFLMRQGSNVNWLNHRGESALDQAIEKGGTNIIKILRDSTTLAEH